MKSRNRRPTAPSSRAARTQTRKPAQAALAKLAAYRHALRRFLALGERNATRLGLTPQQHQALLSISAGYRGRSSISVGELAKHLFLKHHSAVELAGRLELAGLIRRTTSRDDGRVVLLSLTARGERVLHSLSRDSLNALRRASPVILELMQALNRPSGRKKSRKK